jgi:hypothetical protein
MKIFEKIHRTGKIKIFEKFHRIKKCKSLKEFPQNWQNENL